MGQTTSTAPTSTSINLPDAMDPFHTAPRIPNDWFFPSDAAHDAHTHKQARERIRSRLNLLNAILSPNEAPTIPLAELPALRVEHRPVKLSQKTGDLTFSPGFFHPLRSNVLVKYSARCPRGEKGHAWDMEVSTHRGSASSSLMSVSTLLLSNPSSLGPPSICTPMLSTPDLHRPVLNGQFSVLEDIRASEQVIPVRQEHRPSSCTLSQISSLDLDHDCDDCDYDHGYGYGYGESDSDETVHIEHVPGTSIAGFQFPASQLPGSVNPGRMLLRHAQAMYESVRGGLACPREGIESVDGYVGGTLRDLVALVRVEANGYTRFSASRPDPISLELDERLARYPWKCRGIYMGSCLSGVITSVLLGVGGTNDTLCVGELKAVVRLLLARYDAEDDEILTIPALVISYMGSGHGRILQAHHDGKRLVVQHSPLMAFDVETSCPLLIFARYTIARPLV